MSRRLLAALLAAAALGGCGPVPIEANRDGGVVRFRAGSGARHDAAILRAAEHCRSEGFTTYSVVREYKEDGVWSIDFACRN